MKNGLTIPKIIHYCRFGGGKKNDVIQRCMNSWKKYLGDYKFIEHNEINTNISSLPFLFRKAYNEKKYSLVADYIRIKAIYEEGGIYLDMDVEVYKNFDVLLLGEAFFGKIIYEDILLIKTQIFGGVKNLDIFKQLLLIYNELNDLKEGALDFVFSDFFIGKYNIKNPYKSEVIDGVCFYDIDYFSGPLFLYCRHLALDSWVSYNSDYVKNKIILKYKVIHILNISSFRNILKMYFKKSEKLNYKKLL